MNIKAGWMLLEGWQGGDDPVWMAVPRTEQMWGRLAGTGLPDSHCLARAAQAEELAASSDSSACPYAPLAELVADTLKHA